MARILVIDDNENIRETLTEILALHNYAVSSASNGEEALALIEQNRPDLIITDLIMPEKGGISVIREVGQKYPDIKIFAISGGWIGPKEQFLNTAKELGALRTFAKPVNWEELKNAVESELE